LRDAEQLCKRQIEGRKSIGLANGKVHRKGGGRHHKSIKARTGKRVLAIKK
jgi:hypothetical protein